MSEPEPNTVEAGNLVARERRLRLAAILVVLGLSIEYASLQWAHPTAFIVFVAGTGTCVAGGVLLFLGTLLGSGPTPRTHNAEGR
jgi:hypothetical protein